MHVLALSVELHLPACRSLKAKRGVLKPVIEGIRKRYLVAAAEVAHQDTWQRAALGVVAVSGSVTHTTEQIDEVERFIWSFPTLQVLSTERHWLEVD